MTLAAVTLDDKYAAWSGEVYMTGTQALVRLPMMQQVRDEAAGLDTACMITGYRGSPLGNFDRALWQARPFIEKHGVHFMPGVNEDTAATALWGTQQVGLFPGAKHDGVFAIWYGKGPGVDRTMDVFKHANLAGTAPRGGVLALAGDDHVCASSTTAHQSEFDFMSATMPVINPAGVQEFLDYGLQGWGLSRYAGLWVGFICIAETVDSSAIVSVDPHRVTILTPDDHELPEGGLNIRWPDTPLAMEERLLEHKLDAARAYGRANGLDRSVIDGPGRRLGIVTTGKSYLDVRQALDDLGIDEGTARRLGLALYKVGMSWPLEPDGIRKFAGGLDEILVVEEKRDFIEGQIKELLYNLPASARPRVIGTCDEEGRPLLRASGELDPGVVAQTLADRLLRFGADEGIEARVARLQARWAEAAAAEPAAMERVPYFCSGCPHNSSTKIPEGSRALSGIGCHYMVQWMDRETDTYTHMGGEGANWIGQAPFTETEHIFQNIGDGTYFHSGILAIRAAVASGVSMTYKILYNDAVAMTGGQPMDGPLSVQRVTRQIQAEGVGRIAVVTDQPEKYPFDGQFADGVTIHHRDELDRVQRDLRQWEGVSAIVYDQMCATEKRRRRKRGTLEDPDWRVIINPDVCEGCGDCGVQSNCLSVVPLETEFGRKRAIDQSACNKDFSCIKGFCPSFVLVKGGRLCAGASKGAADGPIAVLPEPARPSCAAPYGILLAGVGGTGIVTLGALLGTAARLEGKGATVLDKAGLAQKYGAVTSHIRIAERPEDLHAVRIATGGARLLLGVDLVVAASGEAVARLDRSTSHAVVNGGPITTGDFTRAPDLDFPADQLERVVGGACDARAGRRRRDPHGDGADRRCRLRQPLPPGLRLPAGPGPARRRGAGAGDRAQRRRRRVQRAGLPLGPRGSPRPGGRGGGGGRDRRRAAGAEACGAGRADRAPGRRPPGLSEHGARRPLPRPGEPRARGRAGAGAGPRRVRRGGRPRLSQAARLQGRVRGGAALLRRPLPAPGGGAVRGIAGAAFQHGAAARRRPRPRDRPPEEAPLRPVDARRIPPAGKVQGPARDAARHLRLQRRAAQGARADRRVRICGGDPDRGPRVGQPRARRGDRRGAAFHARLRPREGGQHRLREGA